MVSTVEELKAGYRAMRERTFPTVSAIGGGERDAVRHACTEMCVLSPVHDQGSAAEALQTGQCTLEAIRCAVLIAASLVLQTSTVIG